MILIRSLPVLLALGPLAAQAADRHGHSCKPAKTKTVWVTHYVSDTGPESTSSQSLPSVILSSAPTSLDGSFPSSSSSSTSKSHGSDESPTTKEQTSKEVMSSATSSTESSTTMTKVKSTKAASTTLSTTTKGSKATASFALFPEATIVDVGVSATEQCGNKERVQLDGMPWGVANSMYHADSMVGTQCTNFDDVLQAADGTYLVEWTSVTNVEHIDDTNSLCKGYSNIGIGKNLKNKLSAIKSIPATYEWSRVIETEFKGGNVYDCITSPVQGQEGGTAGTSEFMLFLHTDGGQKPIGIDNGPVKSFDMYGTTFQMYQGVNQFNGVTVRSMIPDTPFDGEFQGDLKEWLDAMVDNGWLKNSDFVNILNFGTEVFWGNSTMHGRGSLNVNLA